MSALWGTTKTAVNTGYGMSDFGKIGLPNPYYKPRPWGIPGIHPELLMEPPYAQSSHKMYTRGSGALVKGSKEAKARMAYLRSLRGRGRKCGGKSALHGRGDSSFSWGEIASDLGESAQSAIRDLAYETGSSIKSLLSNPVSLIKKLTSFAPSVARGIKNLFKKKKKKNTPQVNSKQYKKYLAMLKRINPSLYKKKMQEHQRKVEKQRYDFDDYNLYDDDDDYNLDDDDYNLDDDDDYNLDDDYYDYKKKPRNTPVIA